MSIVALSGKALHARSAERNTPALRPECAGQKIHDRGLSAPGRPDDRRHTGAGKGHGYVVHHIALSVVGKRDVLQPQFARLCLRSAPDRLRLIEQGEDLSARAHAVHRHMKRCAERAQRQEKLHRRQNQKERGERRKPPAQHARHRHGNAGARAAVGHKIHDRCARKLHGEHLHRDAAKFFARFVHLFLPRGVGAENFELPHPLHAVEKGVAHGGIFAPVLCKDLLCIF